MSVDYLLPMWADRTRRVFLFGRADCELPSLLVAARREKPRLMKYTAKRRISLVLRSVPLLISVLSLFFAGMALHRQAVRSGTIGDTLSGLMGYTFGHHALEPSNPDGRDYSICYAGA
jgi:dolichol kinase